MLLAILGSGFSGSMTRQTPFTMLYNLTKWNRESVQSGAKDYAPDFKQLAFYQSDEFKRQRAYLERNYTVALVAVEEWIAARAAQAIENVG